MAYQDQFYTVGTVTVTDGSTAVTGAGAGWETALIVGGVFYAGGGAYPIQSVASETELTLAIPYIGIDAAGVNYAIDRQRAAAISNIAMNDRLAQIIREISIGNIEDLNALELVALQVIGTDAAGKLTQSPMTAAARALLNISGAADADKFAYLTGNDEAQLADISQQARTMLASTTPAETSLGYTPLNRAGDTVQASLGVTDDLYMGKSIVLPPPTGQVYALSSTSAITIAQGSPFIAYNFSGLMIVTNTNQGGTVGIVCGGGSVTTAFQVGTHNAGNFTWAQNENGYAFFNQGGAANFSVILIRTRNGA